MEYTQFLDLLRSLLPEAQDILPTHHLASDLGLCSFDMMMFLFQIESSHGCQVDISSIKKDMTVKDLFDLIQRKEGL